MLFLFELYFKTSEALNSYFISWKLVRANLICICFVTKQLHSASLVFVFFACIISVILRSGTVLDKLSVKKNIFFFLEFRCEKQYVLVISVARLSCWLGSFFFLIKTLCFLLWVLGSLMTSALMVSSLRLSTCFDYDKRAWVIYFSLSRQWYIFETSNHADKIGFILFSGRWWETTRECGAHNKAFLVTLVYGMFLLLFTFTGSQT